MIHVSINQLYRTYGLIPSKFLTPQSGYRNLSYPAKLSGSQLVNLIIYKDEPNIISRIRLTNQVSDFLADNGMPARKTIDHRILQINLAHRARFCSIYNYLPGKSIPWDAYTKKHLKLLGDNLAQVHAKLQSLELKDSPDIENELDETLVRMKRYFDDYGVKAAMRAKLNLNLNNRKLGKYQEILKLCKKLPSRQMLHMDFVRSNILFQDQPGLLKISGILDFEKTARGPIIIDLARTLAFLFVDCKYKSNQEVRQNFLISGYIRRGGGLFINYSLSHKKKNFYLLELLMEMFWLHDFYKHLKHNPYERLEENQHFAKTKDQLLERGVINSVASP